MCQRSLHHVVADDQIVWHAIVLLEKAVAKSPSNFQFKLLLIQLYSMLGELGRRPSLSILSAIYSVAFRL